MKKQHGLLQIGVAAASIMVSACGISIHASNPNDSPIHPRQLTASGMVRYSAKNFASNVRFTTGSAKGTLVVTFTSLDTPLMKTLSMDYAPTSTNYPYVAMVHPLVCRQTAESIVVGMREFTCTMARLSDSDVYSTYYLQSLRFTLEGVPGTFEFQSSCDIYCSSATSDVYLDQTRIPSLEVTDSIN